MWGYDPDQVDLLLDRLLWSYDEAWRGQDQLREQVATLEHELSAYRESDGFLRHALVTAERVAAEVRSRAEEEATHLVEAAEGQAREMIGKGQSRWEELKSQAEKDATSLVESARARADEIASEAERRREEADARAADHATRLLEEAGAEAERIVDEAEKRRVQVRAEIERLEALKEEMERGLRAFVLAALELLDHETRPGTGDGLRAASVDTPTPAASE